MHHYTDCGLRNVYLNNGYQKIDTPYGKGLVIEDLDGLYRAIGLSLVNHKPRLSGSEVRYLRVGLNLSQYDLARILGVAETSVRGWENHRTKITKPTERLLRALYREHVAGDGSIRDMVEALNHLNQKAYERKLELETTNAGWREVA